MTREAGFYLLKTDHLDLSPLNPSGSHEPATIAANLERLASALAASPAWKKMPEAILVVRRSPRPELAVVGYFEPAERVPVEGLQWQLEHLLPRLRYVSYQQAEEDCERLAQQLLDRFSRSELSTFHFEAIPRGGFIVLGMLSYVLGLKASQLGPWHEESGKPHVIVDDCAISGTRFSRFLRRRNDSGLIFAHLYSHPDLRRKIEEDARVLACASAHDLADHAPSVYGDQYPAWRKQWMERSKAAYWIGQPDYVCFAWNEPDFLLWNPITERAEVPWRILPPEFCLKNRPGPEAGNLRVQLQQAGNGPLSPSGRALYGELEGNVILADLKLGETLELAGVAADMWKAIIEGGSLEAAEAIVAETYQVDPDTLHVDLESFVQDLSRRGLLEDGKNDPQD